MSSKAKKRSIGMEKRFGLKVLFAATTAVGLITWSLLMVYNSSFNSIKRKRLTSSDSQFFFVSTLEGVGMSSGRFRTLIVTGPSECVNIVKEDAIRPPSSSQVIRIAVVESDQKIFITDIDRSKFDKFEDRILGNSAKQFADEIDRLLFELRAQQVIKPVIE